MRKLLRPADTMSDNPDVDEFEVGDVLTHHYRGSPWNGHKIVLMKIGGGKFGLVVRNITIGQDGRVNPKLCTKDKFLSAARKVIRDARA